MSAIDQPTPSIRAPPTGASANCPKEPPAAATPSAMLRFSGGTARPTGPSTTANPVALMPRATSTPWLRCSPTAPPAQAIQSRPAT